MRKTQNENQKSFESKIYSPTHQERTKEKNIQLKMPPFGRPVTETIIIEIPNQPRRGSNQIQSKPVQFEKPAKRVEGKSNFKFN